MKYVGIWIDLKEANIIVIEDKQVKQKTILSNIETRERIEGESKAFGRFGDQYLNNEKTKKNKIDKLTKSYLKNVIDSIKKADKILIFGPAQIKIKLGNLIHDDPNLSIKLDEIQNADQMTANQKVAYVKTYFKK
ncbi:MAG: hypothetical protein J7K34_05910 [Flavobacteriaceae bacterium]|nr:hypothetical protein [Flavobacteriaceae bacterium]